MDLNPISNPWGTIPGIVAGLLLCLRPRVGTRSVLYGAHCFFLHPIFVAIAWIKLYGFPRDPRYWIAFIVHDWGYWGCRNMDGEEGEHHVFLGAKIMGFLFDGCSLVETDTGVSYRANWDSYPLMFRMAQWLNEKFGHEPEGRGWYCFTFYHSRFMAKRYNSPISRLCVADKLAFCVEPAWLYLPRAIASGEIQEYMACATGKESKYKDENIKFRAGYIAWHRSVKQYLSAWVRAEIMNTLVERGLVSKNYAERAKIAKYYDTKPPFDAAEPSDRADAAAMAIEVWEAVKQDENANLSEIQARGSQPWPGFKPMPWHRDSLMPERQSIFDSPSQFTK